MTRKELSQQIIESLLDEGLVSLEFDDYKQGLKECSNKIYKALNNYIIIQGETLD